MEVNPRFVIFPFLTMISGKLIFVLYSDAGIYDRVVIQELLKTMAQSHQLESTLQKDFKGLCTASVLKDVKYISLWCVKD